MTRSAPRPAPDPRLTIIRLSEAHLHIDVPRATIYRWHKEGRIATFEERTGHGGWQLCVRLSELQAAKKLMRRVNGRE